MRTERAWTAVLLAALGLAGCGGGGATDAGVDAAADAGVDAATDAGWPDTGPHDGGPLAWDGGPAPRPATTTLPAACAVAAPQVCNPLDGAGCDLASGETCDLAADGTYQCFAGPADAALGARCDGLDGPFCGAGLTCVGTRTGAGTCARFCCDDAACGPGGTCRALVAVGASRGSVGTCVAGTTADAGVADGGVADGGVSDGGVADGGVADGGAGDAGTPALPTIGHHPALLEGRGFLVPWTPWRDALSREMTFYATACPPVAGYPMFASVTHYGDACAVGGDEVIVAMQDGTGILSYLAYDAATGGTDSSLLATARALGDYMIDQGMTPARGLWPRVPRSTGEAGATPQPDACGMRSDFPYEIEPDKTALAAYALVKLSAATREPRYLDAAVAIAHVLAANQAPGDETHSPWPFRVHFVSGAPRGRVSANQAFTLRLYDALIALGHAELAASRDALWRWVRDYQIPSAAHDGALWANFFEDWVVDTNRNAWSPLHLARYLMEGQDAIDPDWRLHVGILLGFVEANFVEPFEGWTVCIEQDLDRRPYGGILSTYGATLARWASITGATEDRARARSALAIVVHGIDDDGCPGDLPIHAGRGGWQEDAHTDKVHNLLEALSLFPEWGN